MSPRYSALWMILMGLGLPLSPQGARVLTGLEGGAVPHVYADSAGYPTIGVGHLLTPAEQARGVIVIAGKGVKYGSGLSPGQMTALFEQDAGFAERAVASLVHVPLTPCQLDALVSFVYNVGVLHFRQSTLLRLLNTGQYTQVPLQMQRWVYANHQFSRGLAERRRMESNLWNGVLT